MRRGGIFDPACAERKGGGKSGRSPTGIEGKADWRAASGCQRENARFLQSEVHGIAVDDAVIRAYEGLNRAQGEELAVRLCRDAAERIAPFVDGYYIMTPFQRTGLVCRVMEAIE